MADNGPSDLDLFDRWCAGDKEAGAVLFRRYYRAVYRFFETKGMSNIEEPVQETFLACLRKRDEFRRESGFRTFLFGIARNAFLEYWRGLKRQRTQIDFEEISIASLSTTLGRCLARRTDRSRLLEALQQLSVDQQILLELSYWEQLSTAELAVIFRVDPVTIRTRLFRARVALLGLIQSSKQTDLSVSEEADFAAWARSLPDPDPTVER